MQAALAASDAKLAAINARMIQLSTQSSLALQTLQDAQRTEQEALATQTLQAQRLTDLQTRVSELHLQLGRWARAAYVSGGTLARYEAYVAALQVARSDQVGNSLFLINYVGQGEDQALREADTLASVQQIVSQQADQAAAAATTARVAAAAGQHGGRGRARPAAAAAADRGSRPGGPARHGQLHPGLLNNTNAANLIVARAAVALRAGITSAARAAAPASPRRRSPASTTARSRPRPCARSGGARPDAPRRRRRRVRPDVQGLRPQFGRPICVTDSYRSYSAQVALYAAKPNLAARPGHQQPRLGRRGRPVRRGPVVRHGRAQLAVHPRAAVRLVPPGLGRADRVPPGALALGVRALSAIVRR